MHIKIPAILIFATLACSCASPLVYNDTSKNSVFEALNPSPLIYKGMSKDSVFEVLNLRQVEPGPMASQVLIGSQTEKSNFELLYVSEAAFQGGPTEGFIPFLFKNDSLVTFGWDNIDVQAITVSELPNSSRMVRKYTRKTMLRDSQSGAQSNN